LLNDVFAESDADWRAGMLGDTLSRVRRRRRFRQWRNSCGVVAATALLGVLLHHNFVSPQEATTSGPNHRALANYELVRSRPLSPWLIVRSQPYSQLHIIASSSIVTEVSTTHADLRQINDDELLAFASGRPAVLFRLGPGSEELVFANQQNKEGFSLP
jgi:hypothetical protein